MSTEAASLPHDVALCHAMLREQATAIEQLQRKLEQTEHYLTQLLKQRFGPRSEKVDPAQLALFDPPPDEPPPVTTAEQPATKVREHVRRGGGRNPLPANLPRKRVEYPLPAEELPCPCCGRERSPFGEETSEQLEFIPASMYVIEHVRLKYVCRHCQEHVATAPKPPQPIDKGLPGPGLLAFLTVGKYGDHLPLYREEEILARFGVEIARSTLCDWMRQTAELLEPLHQRMTVEVLRSRVIHTDDTPVPVLDRKLPHTRTGRFWVYCGDAEHPYSVYDYTASRKRDGPAEFLNGYQGYLQADAFSGYDGIYLGSQGQIIEVACWAHARRKFHEAQRTAGTLAHEALARMAQLYAIERELNEKQATDDERRAVRQQRAVPLLAAFDHWLTQQRALPKSPIGQAIAYARNQWQALCRYTEQGYLAIDNNLSERTVRAQAIGRKNWLFAGSDQGGRTAAVLFTIVGSAKRNEVEPFAYLRDVLTRLPVLVAAASTGTSADLTDLLPDRWLLSHSDARLTRNRPR